jgi:uncharacterized protein (DUF1330 family)
MHKEWEQEMVAYVIAQIDVTDAETFAKYRDQVPATIARYGGRYVVRGGAVETVEGTFARSRLVVIEFPSTTAAKTWWDSPEYIPLRALRQSASDGDVAIVEGL